MSLFEPDILNDTAAFGGRRHSITGERRLLMAILADALDCYQKNIKARHTRGRRLYREAERWLLSDDVIWVFSFRNVCAVLGIDPAALRRRARLWHGESRRVRAPVTAGGRLHARTI